MEESGRLTFMLYRFTGSAPGRCGRVGDRTGSGVGPLVWTSSVVDVAGVVVGEAEPMGDEFMVEEDIRRDIRLPSGPVGIGSACERP